MPADDAQFGGGRPVGMNQPLVVNAARSELIEQALAVKIIADKAGNRDLTAEPGEVMRDVGRAAQRFLCAGHMRDRHRRFRRDPGDLAVIVFVEHHIADDKDAAVRRAAGHKVI